MTADKPTARRFGMGKRTGQLVLESGEKGSGDDGGFVAAEGAEVEQVLALLDPTENRWPIQAHSAGQFVHVHGLRWIATTRDSRLSVASDPPPRAVC